MRRTRSILPAPYDIAGITSRDGSHPSDDVGEGGQVLVDTPETHAHRVDAQMSRAQLLPTGDEGEPAVPRLAGNGEPSLNADFRRTPSGLPGVTPNAVEQRRGLVIRWPLRQPAVTNSPDASITGVLKAPPPTGAEGRQH